MNRFHVHVHVADLEGNIRFYSTLFGAEPTVRKHDYAKWMIDDPRVNFAISTLAGQKGVSHLGLQTETGEELAAIGARLEKAGAVALAEVGTTCCYAKSDKFWATDPQGVRWETFRSFGSAATYFSPEKPVSSEQLAVESPDQSTESACGSGACCPAASA